MYLVIAVLHDGSKRILAVCDSEDEANYMASYFEYDSGCEILIEV
jgi:hypothetical protein